MLAIVRCRIFLSSSLLSENIRIKIHRIVIFPFVLYECETWSLTEREEGKLMLFEERVLMRIFGSKRDEVTGSGENYIGRVFMICA
jgi:hypothetical protein